MTLFPYTTLFRSLSEEQKQSVESMGFGSMLKLKMKHIDNKLLTWLLLNIDRSTRSLIILGKRIEITADTVRRSIGIPQTNKPVGKMKHPYEERFLDENKKKIDLKMLEDKLMNCKSNDEEFKILYLMSLFSTILLPTDGTLNLTILDYIVDLQNIHDYNWAEFVLKGLMDGIDNFYKAKS